jgi:hypothetical protein
MPTTRTPTGHIDPCDVLARIIKNEPDWDEAVVKAECWNTFIAGWQTPIDQGLMYAAFTEWFDDHYRKLTEPRRRRNRR